MFFFLLQANRTDHQQLISRYIPADSIYMFKFLIRSMLINAFWVTRQRDIGPPSALRVCQGCILEICGLNNPGAQLDSGQIRLLCTPVFYGYLRPTFLYMTLIVSALYHEGYLSHYQFEFFFFTQETYSGIFCCRSKYRYCF